MSTPQTPNDGAARENDSCDALEMRLLDGLLGQLSAEEGPALAAQLGQDADLARQQAEIAALLGAESAAFSAESDPGWDASRASKRVAAWVRESARVEEAAARQRENARTASSGSGWARILAWSVGLHVALLGVFALVLREDSQVEETPGAHIAMFEDPGFLEEEADPLEAEFARGYPNLNWRDVASISDAWVLQEQETWSEELPGAFEEAAEAAARGGRLADAPVDRRGMFDQPLGVVAATIRRTNQALKRRRLDLLGFNAEGTLRAVELGLAYLAPRQNKDGSWSSAGSRDAATAEVEAQESDIKQTAIALLAFLGDGNSSHTASSRGSDAGDTEQAARRRVRGAVVAKGIHWLRDQLFNASRSDAERAAHLATRDMTVLGPATVALCEDYMLSYGWLSPEAAERRAREIAELAGRLLEQSANDPIQSASDLVEQPWAVWGMDAASRVGVVASTERNLRSFRRWVETAANATPTLSAMSFLSVGTALLYQERGAEKPRFLRWSKANAKRLAAKLGPHGYVRSADPVGDTALVLLGLQVAYRTY